MQTSVKTCFKCSVERPIENFYKHAEMADGHLNKCKSCAIQDAKAHRIKNLEQVREYDRKRGSRLSGEYVKSYRLKNPEKLMAHQMVSKAVRGGKLKKPKACQDCGVESKHIHGHHEDYSKPLQVLWVCPACHKARHKLCGECWLAFGKPGCRCHLGAGLQEKADSHDLRYFDQMAEIHAKL